MSEKVKVYEPTPDDLTKEAFHNLLPMLRASEAYMDARAMIPFIEAGHNYAAFLAAQLGPCRHDEDFCICDLLEVKQDLADVLTVNGITPGIVVIAEEGDG